MKASACATSTSSRGWAAVFGVSAAFVRFSLSVARGLGHGTRVNLATGVAF